LTLSVVLAIVISFVALGLTFHFRGETAAWGWMKITSALVMGAAIPVMHYTGMAAASFAHSSSADQDLSHAVSISSLGITRYGHDVYLVFSNRGNGGTGDCQPAEHVGPRARRTHSVRRR
jgi:NO-binding membrane sensor protein with MHYT domain